VNLLDSPSMPLLPEKRNDVDVGQLRAVVNQNPLPLDQRLGSIAMANHDRVVENVKLQFRTRREVKLFAYRFWDDDPARTVNGSLHAIMVSAMP